MQPLVSAARVEGRELITEPFCKVPPASCQPHPVVAPPPILSSVCNFVTTPALGLVPRVENSNSKYTLPTIGNVEIALRFALVELVQVLLPLDKVATFGFIGLLKALEFVGVCVLSVTGQGVVLAPELKDFISDVVGRPFALCYQFLVLCSITQLFYGRARIL